MDYKVEIPIKFERVVQMPLSKSIAARELIVNALCGVTSEEGCGSETTGSAPIVSFCDDIDILARALASDGERIDVGASGTAMRFLTAFFACCQGRTVTLDGSERLRQRPVGALVDALRQLGAVIDYLGEDGYPPLKIEGRELHGGAVTLRGDVSSQFVSALLMISPVVGGLSLTITGDIVSRPYIDMTLAVMRRHGITARWHRKTVSHELVVPAGSYESTPLYIEGDWSAASYWFALTALRPESRIVLSPLFDKSLQGDRAIVEMMTPLGVVAHFLDDGVVLQSSTGKLPRRYERDMSGSPDLVPPLAVTLCLLRVPFLLTGVSTLRLKESDRLDALRVELAKLGYSIEVGDNSLCYDGSHSEIVCEVTLSSHGDHRIAMALSLAATRHKIVITDAQVVSKSYPLWWQQLGGEPALTPPLGDG